MESIFLALILIFFLLKPLPEFYIQLFNANFEMDKVHRPGNIYQEAGHHRDRNIFMRENVSPSLVKMLKGEGLTRDPCGTPWFIGDTFARPRASCFLSLM